MSLVLGGGGARGLAHLGVLRVLEEEDIPVRGVVANSAGAIVGSLWLQHESAAQATGHVLEFLDSPGFRRLRLSFKPHGGGGGGPSFLHRLLSGWHRQVAMHLLFRRPAVFHRRRLEAVVHGLVRDGAIEELRRPLLVVALDLCGGEAVVLERGPLRPAVVATASVAGFFPPVDFGSRSLIDSGQADNLPVDVARQRLGRPVVAVNLSADIEERTDFSTGIEVLFRSEELGSRWNNFLRSRAADVVITPRLGGRYWLDFSEAEEAVAAGIAAARDALPRIRSLLADQGSPDQAVGSLDPSARS